MPEAHRDRGGVRDNRHPRIVRRARVVHHEVSMNFDDIAVRVTLYHRWIGRDGRVWAMFSIEGERIVLANEDDA